MNEGQKQILSKGDLKRYKCDEEENTGSRSSDINDGNEGPEEVSVLLHRGSRIVKDFDMLRFSKASSVDQNFMAENDQDSRLGLYNRQQSSGQKGGPGQGHAHDR